MAGRPSKPACLVLVDNSATKLGMIPEGLLEGVHTINSSKLSQDELVAKLKQLTPTGLGMDVALDCVGNEAVVNAAYQCLDKLGIVMTVGGSATAKPQYAIERNLVNGLTIRGTHQGDSVSRVMIPELIRRWRAGTFAFDKLLTQFKFEELDKALHEMHEGRVIKPLLVL